MVKADLSRDYYGDLEILPTADTAEIKKQFKKLGMASMPPDAYGKQQLT
jgi:DnaJ-class molecular chaperone